MPSRLKTPGPETPQPESPVPASVNIEQREAWSEDDCFATFTEWASEADEEAYADL